MNIAFPAGLLFLFLSPGFVFHRFFQTREIRAADLTPFSSTVLMASTVAVVVNTLVMYVAVCWAGYQFRLGELLRLFIGGTSAVTEAALSLIYRRLDDFPFEPFWFFFATNVLAIIAASFWRFQLDAPSGPFYKHIRPPAPWHYLFVGIDATSNTDAVVVSAVVPFKDASYIYTGILKDYELTDKGELDRLILSNTSRRRLSDERDPSDSSSPLDSYKYFYQIEGDRFVLRTSEYTTLNIQYLVLEDSTVDVASGSSTDGKSATTVAVKVQ